MFAVLPTRELAAAFAGLGCLVAGADIFEDALSWTTFRNLPFGRGVFWTVRNGADHYGGKIVGFRGDGSDEFIVLEVTKARRKSEKGFLRQISRAHFHEYRFTVDEPPSLPRQASFAAVGKSIGLLVENLNPKWIWADGAEGLLVTNIASFESSVAGLSISIDGQVPITMSEFLCLGRNKEQTHAKLRIDHPRGTIGGSFPLAILDGAKAFSMHEHLASVSNMLVILDRSEYQEGINDSLLGLRSISLDLHEADFQYPMPGKLSLGVELAAYLIDGQ